MSQRALCNQALQASGLQCGSTSDKVCLGEGEDVSGNYKDMHACSIVLMLWKFHYGLQGVWGFVFGLGIQRLTFMGSE